MTANAKSATVTYSVFRHQSMTLTSGQTVYAGDEAAVVTGTGKLVKMVAGRTDLIPWGVFEDDTAATADTTVLVDRLHDVHCKKYANDTGTAITLVGSTAYGLDSATATGASTSNSVLGQVQQIDSDGVWIKQTSSAAASFTAINSLGVGGAIAFASHDAVLTVGGLTTGDVYTVPTDTAAATVTLPTSGSPVAGTIVYFAYPGGGTSANTITYRQGTTALTAAFAGDKKHMAIAVFTTYWTVIASVAP